MSELTEVIREKKEEEEEGPNNSDIMKKFSELKQDLGLLEKPIVVDDKDKIIGILREEIKLITQINKKVLEEKDRIIKEQQQTIERLKVRLKRDTNYPYV